MGYKTILVDRENAAAVEIEEQLYFVFSVLHSSGISEEKLELCFNDGFSVVNKIALRKLCERERISIITDDNNSLKIYIQDNTQDVLIAEWYTPTHVLRIDKKNSEQSKKILTEINFKWWTFEEEVDNDKKK